MNSPTYREAGVGGGRGLEVVADAHVKEAAARVVHQRVLALDVELELARHVDVEAAAEVKAGTRSVVVVMLIFPVVESDAGKRVDVEAASYGKGELEVDTCHKCRFALIAEYVSNLRSNTDVGRKRVLEIQVGISAAIVRCITAGKADSLFSDSLSRSHRGSHERSACKSEREKNVSDRYFHNGLY